MKFNSIYENDVVISEKDCIHLFKETNTSNIKVEVSGEGHTTSCLIMKMCIGISMIMNLN